jgi:hypothetical protein
LPAARLPPERPMFPEPATAVAVPLHVLASALGVDTTSPAGNESLKLTPVSVVVALPLLIVKVNPVVPLRGIEVAPKTLEIDGGDATERLSEAVLPVPPFVELTGPLVFGYWPSAAPLRFTAMVQLLLAAMVPPVRLMLPEPAAAVAVPLHVLVSPFGVDTTSPVGRVSLKATPVSATALAAGFVIVKVSVVAVPGATGLGLNTLAIDGGATDPTETADAGAAVVRKAAAVAAALNTTPIERTRLCRKPM